PGVGSYTSAAIAAFAFAQPALVLDTNIRRVIMRAWGGRAAAPAHQTRAEVELATSLVTAATGAKWAAAVMELGAVVCTARAPRCEQCPISASCTWLADGKPANGPARRAQPVFTGSDRQARGALLRAVSSASPASQSAIEAAWADEVQRERAMTSLIGDGLVIRAREGYVLPGDECR
ncbi:MAG: A/G-specific adenine glycosylase, partial [Candidatus Nanopelagicales bacterium]